MTTKYCVKLSHDDEALVEHVRMDAGIVSPELMAKAALLLFSEIYMRKQEQLDAEKEESSETDNSPNTSQDSENTEETQGSDPK